MLVFFLASSFGLEPRPEKRVCQGALLCRASVLACLGGPDARPLSDLSDVCARSRARRRARGPFLLDSSNGRRRCGRPAQRAPSSWGPGARPFPRTSGRALPAVHTAGAARVDGVYLGRKKKNGVHTGGCTPPYHLGYTLPPHPRSAPAARTAGTVPLLVREQRTGAWAPKRSEHGRPGGFCARFLRTVKIGRYARAHTRARARQN